MKYTVKLYEDDWSLEEDEPFDSIEKEDLLSAVSYMKLVLHSGESGKVFNSDNICVAQIEESDLWVSNEYAHLNLT